MTDNPLDFTEYACCATLTVSLEIETTANWGGGARAAEVMEQGGSEAFNALKNALDQSKLKYKIVGRPDYGLMTWRRKP